MWSLAKTVAAIAVCVTQASPLGGFLVLTSYRNRQIDRYNLATVMFVINKMTQSLLRLLRTVVFMCTSVSLLHIACLGGNRVAFMLRQTSSASLRLHFHNKPGPAQFLQSFDQRS